VNECVHSKSDGEEEKSRQPGKWSAIKASMKLFFELRKYSSLDLLGTKQVLALAGVYVIRSLKVQNSIVLGTKSKRSDTRLS